ncbi:gliding motility lipoprotein GldD [Leeuwenhoekiella polynyae]|uniref:Protein involved in gliding motility GldD n=1 Tax=Leeuwenhoekiella polynyae TaxID=1550906 RepID=A0A4Q0P933_9FLAO|nr:gliding motility lipoprotein GldD [Leeuwenhoekiella polynyae]RXG23065.1 protein involved in gliding motility GldD [Leeuwenhoekiella polynyae]
MKNFSFTFVLFLVLTSFGSCKEDVLPKPNAFLALNYNTPEYTLYGSETCPYEFMKNTSAVVRYKSDCSVILEYPDMDGALYLTYRNVDGNIKQLLTDAQKLTYEHVIKADNIAEEKYINPEHNVYGMFYDVAGNAASQSQFYVTDSTSYFITGSIYFNVTPNYDSILPAAAYLKTDIRHLMESLRWKK